MTATAASAPNINAGTPPLTRFLAGLSKRLVILIPASMLLGLVAGLFVDLTPLKAAIVPLTMLMVYPMLVNFKPREALAVRSNAGAVGLAMGLNFIVLPVVAWLIARSFFGSNPELFVGMILASVFPTSGMTISWTGFAKGNVAAAVSMTVIGLILAGFAAPFYLLLFAGTRVDVNVAAIAQTVLLVVLVPMVAGSLTRTLLVRRMGPKQYKARVAPVFPGLSTVGVLAVVFLAIGLKADMIVSSPSLLLTILVPLLVFYAVNFALATGLGRTLLPRGDAIAVVYGTVMRNLSIALGIAIASFGPEAALVLALAYIVQVQSAAWYVRLTNTVFGAPREAEEAAKAPSTA